MIAHDKIKEVNELNKPNYSNRSIDQIFMANDCLSSSVDDAIETVKQEKNLAQATAPLVLFFKITS
jgi:hypothetical protein